MEQDQREFGEDRTGIDIEVQEQDLSSRVHEDQEI